MRVYTYVEWDIETGKVLAQKYYSYSGTLVLCDRALRQEGMDATKTAAGTAGQYGAAAGGVQSNLVPRLEEQAVNPPGYGPAGLADMQTAAMSSAAGATGSAQEAARLQAMRTGNVAGVGAITAGAAGEGARGAGSALQSILAKNAQLKATQMQQANTGLQGILGEDIRGQVANAGLIPTDINATIAGTEADPWAGYMKQYGDIKGVTGDIASAIVGGMGGGGASGVLKGIAG